MSDDRERRSGSHTRSLVNNFTKSSLDEIANLRRAFQEQQREMVEVERRVNEAVRESERHQEAVLKEAIADLKEDNRERKEQDKEHTQQLQEALQLIHELEKKMTTLLSDTEKLFDKRLTELETADAISKAKSSGFGALGGAGGGAALWALLKYVIGSG